MTRLPLLAFALLLTGCGSPAAPQRAAVVAPVLTQSDLQHLADSGGVIPPGVHELTDTLTLTRPGQLAPARLRGSGRAPFGVHTPGSTVLRANFTGKPIISVLGARDSEISDLSIVGPHHDRFLPPVGPWWHPGPDLAAWPESDARYTPSAGISIGGFSSGVQIRNVDIAGCVVGVVTYPDGGDGQGEFISVEHSRIAFCAYGVSISHTQNRQLKVNATDFLFVHTALTNCTHGRQLGFVDGAISAHFNAVEKLFHLGGSPGVVSLENCYGELIGSLGHYSTGGNRSATAVTLRNVHLRFDGNRMPGLYGDGGGMVSMSEGTIETPDMAVFGLDLAVESVRFRPIRYESGTVAPALRRAVSFTKGVLLRPNLYGTQPYRPHSAAYFPNPAVDSQIGWSWASDPPVSRPFAKASCRYDPVAEVIEFPAGTRVTPGDIVQDDDGLTAWVVLSQAGRGWKVERVNNRGRTITASGNFWLTQPAAVRR